MARYLVCAVRDAAIKAFNTPMYFRTREEAIRSFGDAVRDSKNADFANHASDYSMWYLGDWDDNGSLSPLSSPDCLIQAVDCLERISS
uniref:DNA binding protein VP5 n=1 Tax=Gokushovirinae environmental samples TaxID=1478972 RepID=A0A2R3UAU1_9VIRU|nr:DNA binding protein VP5 [Gokushovirinae environmental samples]